MEKAEDSNGVAASPTQKKEALTDWDTLHAGREAVAHSEMESTWVEAGARAGSGTGAGAEACEDPNSASLAPSSPASRSGLDIIHLGNADHRELGYLGCGIQLQQLPSNAKQLL